MNNYLDKYLLPQGRCEKTIKKSFKKSKKSSHRHQIISEEKKKEDLNNLVWIKSLHDVHQGPYGDTSGYTIKQVIKEYMLEMFAGERQDALNKLIYHLQNNLEFQNNDLSNLANILKYNEQVLQTFTDRLLPMSLPLERTHNLSTLDSAFHNLKPNSYIKLPYIYVFNIDGKRFTFSMVSKQFYMF